MDVVLYSLFNKKIMEAIEGVTQYTYEVVEELPLIGESGIVYLVLNASTEVYDEYVWVDYSFRRIGTQYEITNTTTDVDYIMEGDE